ncbi:MAG: hypothetical protein MSC30_11715 [Gaiellaceae bacterium MAG52_C11]|nr:hypothetical protein [Candidatus Gaiellasilicea maunaloa]
MLLETTLKARLIDTRKHLEALERAVAAFPNGFGLAEFERAWRGEPDERLTVYPIQAGYENGINGCIRIAQELCELEGWTPANRDPSSTEALKLLQENGIVAAKTRAALKDAYERRSEIQHDYVGAAAREVHAAALAVLEFAPLLLQDVALHLKQRG